MMGIPTMEMVEILRDKLSLAIVEVEVRPPPLMCALQFEVMD